MSVQVFVLPDLGEGLTEAEIVRWLVAEGQDVAVDQPVVEVETAKTVVEVPTPFAGRVATLHGAEGQTISVGMPLISVEAVDAPAALDGSAAPADSGESAADSGESAETAAYREEERAGSGNVLVGYGTSDEAVSGRRRRPRTAPFPLNGSAATPVSAARRARPVIPAPAAQSGLAAPPNEGERRIPLSGFHKAAAAAYTRSRAEIPEATIWVDVDATALVALRESARTPQRPGPGLLAHLARIVVAALADFPMYNGRFDAARQEIVTSSEVNLGIAVQGQRGLVAPAVMAAQGLSLAELDTAIDDLVGRARQGRFTASELSEGTFTLNNYGPLGVDGSAPIINHPQVAMIGFGRILDRAWVVDGEITVRKITQLSFVFDHRVGDGVTAAAFVRRVADAIEQADVVPAPPQESTVEVA